MFDEISRYAAAHTAFFFYTDYLGSKAFAYPLENLEAHGIAFSFHGSGLPLRKSLKKFPVSFQNYQERFSLFIQEIKQGNTYLGNITQPTQLETPLTLQEIYTQAQAPYRLHVKDQFVCFSPEPFIIMEGNTISTFPMKGTIDADTPNAQAMILSNQKEMAEHTMIVDLLRNDLSIVATNVRVDAFRYTKVIEAGEKKLLHVSSKISGTLPNNWEKDLGNIIRELLPAGSISGTPKKRTVEILKTIEGYERGFFSGICGYYDGKKLETAVMIRFIENANGKLIYKSGGGITLDSNAEDEYKELLDKVYIP